MRDGPSLPFPTGIELIVTSSAASAQMRLQPVRSATRPTSAWYDSSALREKFHKSPTSSICAGALY
eukprot:2359433-Pleurochrysis_carterae.AAC.1